MSLYGTRDAAMNWEAEIRSTLEGLGFQKGKASACVYRHPGTGATAAVHGDDVLVEGEEADMKRFYEGMAKKY